MTAVNQGNNKDAMSNCAMRTIAAIAGTNTSVLGRVLDPDNSRGRGQSDSHLAAGLGVGGDGSAQLQGVLNSLCHFVEQLMAHKRIIVLSFELL